MRDTDIEPQHEIQPTKTAALPAPAAPRRTGGAVPRWASVRTSNKPKRASKGQREHIRRQEQAGERQMPR